MSMVAVTSIAAIHAGDAVRRTANAASRSTEWMRIQIEATLIAIPIVPRRSAFRLMRIGSVGATRTGRQLGRAPDPHPVEQIAGDDAQRGEPIDHAPAEADRGGFLEVARGDRDLADPAGHPGRDDLGDQLLVEYEVVAVE